MNTTHHTSFGKQLLIVLACLIAALTARADAPLQGCRGVWASDKAEAVITDSVCIVFWKADSTMQAFLSVPTAGIRHKTVFAPDGAVTFPKEFHSPEITRSGNTLKIDGEALRKVEDIETTTPYEMTRCTSDSNVGRCLQEWRLGVNYDHEGDAVSCEINTNRHMFVYLVIPQMVYIRAAATRNNDKGTLFFQNIRMMKNHNTGEYTMHIQKDNLAIAAADLEMDNSKFQPDRCTFNPDGGIYWSLISHEPEKILINGCGETYTVDRPTKEANIKEWIAFKPYSTEFSFPRL